MSTFSDSVPAGGEGAITINLNSNGQTGRFHGVFEVASNDETPEDQAIKFEVNASVLNLAGPASRLTFDEPAGATELIDPTGFNRHGLLNAFDGSAELGVAGLDANTGTALAVSGGGGASTGRNFQTPNATAAKTTTIPNTRLDFEDFLLFTSTEGSRTRNTGR